MTETQEEIVTFLRHTYAEQLRLAHDLGFALTTAREDLGIPEGEAAAQARSSMHAAQTRARFLEETVVAYLGTAGPTGQIADQQLRLLALEFMDCRGYDSAWMS
ncbi:hypothetical protein [Streptomyces sp. KL116D]|uniref:hypothetical protein n=1 Tax=Streptomyces sp. KL116D TaxID=3045152 RepID=UPI003558FAB1